MWLWIAALHSAATHNGASLELELALNQERDNDREQRDSFDERREDDSARLNATGHLRLTRHAVHRLAGKTPDTNARTDRGETSTKTSAEQAPGARVLAGEAGCGLKQRIHSHHSLTLILLTIVISHARDHDIAIRKRSSRSNGILRPLGRVLTRS